MKHLFLFIFCMLSFNSYSQYEECIDCSDTLNIEGKTYYKYHNDSLPLNLLVYTTIDKDTVYYIDKFREDYQITMTENIEFYFERVKEDYKYGLFLEKMRPTPEKLDKIDFLDSLNNSYNNLSKMIRLKNIELYRIFVYINTIEYLMLKYPYKMEKPMVLYLSEFDKNFDNFYKLSKPFSIFFEVNVDVNGVANNLGVSEIEIWETVNRSKYRKALLSKRKTLQIKGNDYYATSLFVGFSRIEIE
ncbi:hypothetical protein WAF17_11445 [Bernardetia sp. ABR2-2B]|uniref:hypothetical protein n=1 Tax=Bernardetia sp. ABR2-2B TaxID=3127472 RepID=UPI0030D0C987